MYIISVVMDTQFLSLFPYRTVFAGLVEPNVYSRPLDVRGYF